MDFPEAWERVARLAGTTFRAANGREFTYRFNKTFVVVSPKELSIPRTNFEKVFRRASEAAAETPAVQGQSYIQAVYADPRFRAGNFQEPAPETTGQNPPKHL